MNIVVTGANGFIGRWLITELAQYEKYQITALIRKGSNKSGMAEGQRISIKEVDYQQDAAKEVFENQDVCIHLIGVLGSYGVRQEIYESVNVELTLRILKWCREANVKQFVFCSTPGVQGFGHRLAVEKEKYAPRNCYEKTKASVDIVLLKEIPHYIFRYKFKLKNIRYYIRNSISMFIPNIAIQVYVSLDKILLGNILGNYQLGLYEASCRLVDATALVQAAVVATTPTLAFLYANQKKEKFLEHIQRTFSLVNFLAFPMCFGMIGIAENFVPWYLGKDLMEVVKLMYLSAFFILTKSWSCVFGDQILMVSQNQRYYTYGVVTGAVIDIIFNILFIFPFQVYGILVASLIAEYTGMFIMMQAVRKRLDISVKNLYKGTGKYLACSVSMCILIHGIGSITPKSMIGTLMQITVGVIYYFVILFFYHDENILQVKGYCRVHTYDKKSN